MENLLMKVPSNLRVVSASSSKGPSGSMKQLGGPVIVELPLDKIRRPLMLTRANDPQKVQELMDSVRAIGLQVPIDVLEVDGVYYACPWPGKWTPLGAELLGIREALNWIKQHGWDEVVVETDATRAVAEITLGSSCSYIGLLGEDIRDLAKLFRNISFSHIMRSANKTAHALARAACSLSESRSWIYSPPFIVSSLDADLINDN